jgi:hypothetical protein
MTFMVDSNIVIDVIDPESPFAMWAVAALKQNLSPGSAWLAPTAYAEVSARQPSVADVDSILRRMQIELLAPSRAALWRAGKAFGDYRARNGKRETILPDFMIGAQAEDIGATLITRDPRRYRTYFPDLKLIAP